MWLVFAWKAAGQHRHQNDARKPSKKASKIILRVCVPRDRDGGMHVALESNHLEDLVTRIPF